MNTKEKASKVLDYWFAIEFLGQDSYETCTDESKLVRELKQYKKADQAAKDRRKQIMVFEHIDSTSDIYTQITQQTKDCGMSTWGNLTFYIGRIKRQSCIEKLAHELGVRPKQAEANSEYIPSLSFQCTANGDYVDHSLSLSTIVWAISQVEGKKNVQLSELLSDKVYSETIEKLEKKFFNTDGTDEQSPEETLPQNVNSENMPIFIEDAISANKISQINSDIVKFFGKYFSENAIEEYNGIKYQLFKDSKAKDKYNDDNYMGLSHDFFSNDLKMVKKSIEDGNEDFSKGMLADLLNYICAPNDMFEPRDRHDLVKPKNEEPFYTEMSEILSIENAPLGKWPSRFMPSLMQQVAVNIAISNKQRGIFEKNGKIFSVNGPPGTGKTTLLKEIIANNIVEKAKILSRYDTPDDAFEGIKFVHGELNGAYAQYYPKWFRFKDDRIGEYGVLVTSSNNTAVENITKELPLESGILDNLKTVNNGVHQDSSEMVQQLSDIRKLFSTSETDRRINIYQKDTKRQGEYPEIYFTGYAQKFLGSAEKDVDAWGLVAAPLGKKSNISGFYYDVLNPIWQDFLMKNTNIENRISQYKKAKEAFCTQLQLVSEIQGKLKKYVDVTIDSHRTQMVYKKITSDNTVAIENAGTEFSKLSQQLLVVNDQMEEEASLLRKLSSKCIELDRGIKSKEEIIKNYSNQEIEYKKQAFDTENAVGFLTKIFRKSKYQAALELAQSYKSKAQECTAVASDIVKTINEEKAEFERQNAEKQRISHQLELVQKRSEQLEVEKTSIQDKIQKLNAEIENAKKRFESADAVRESSLCEYKKAGKTKTGEILDESFIAKVLSGDETTSTKAQVLNPWLTEEFNREREKLFYLALQMTKEFFLSSKSCRANLCILGQYWGLRTESGTDKIKFHKEDREAMVGSLFQTLFILTPVISSTFASVGRLLRDIKDSGTIGTLVIDEAGQAQPQMAVGALFRSRKAIIVGDPKQVEPVVTDDLNLLKEAYSGPIYTNYKNRSLSVQRCADIINPFGTFFENGTDYPDWVGCPLLVHRRCISPMYEISNRISYDCIMKQQTLPPSDTKCESFISRRSQWINVMGTEKGHGDHYVPEQGELVCKMIESAFKKTIENTKNVREKPKLYIITPFTSVVRGIRSAIGTFANRNKSSALAQSKVLGDWLYDNIGTVHKFQGKEANEVIFVLGCDVSQMDKYAVKGFVNSNIVNVAATRAKYRFYMIGDLKVWSKNEYVNEAKSIIDTLPIENIAAIECWEVSEDKNKALLDQASQLPGASSFVFQTGEDEDGEPEYNIDLEEFVSSIDEAGFLNRNLSTEQYRLFGFASKEQFDALSADVKNNLLMGMKLYFLLKPVYDLSPDLDASCCGILFCKGMELYLRKNFANGLKTRFPSYRIKNSSNQMVQLQNAQNKDLMIGTIQFILRNKVNEIGNYMVLKGEVDYATPWWNSFNSKLKSFANKRNECCHPEQFRWQDMRQLLSYEFTEDEANELRTPKIGGVFYESENGRKLND